MRPQRAEHADHVAVPLPGRQPVVQRLAPQRFERPLADVAELHTEDPLRRHSGEFGSAVAPDRAQCQASTSNPAFARSASRTTRHAVGRSGTPLYGMNSSPTTRSPARSHNAPNASTMAGTGGFSNSPQFMCAAPNNRARWKTVSSFSRWAASRSSARPQPVRYSTSRTATPCASRIAARSASVRPASRAAR